MTAGAGQHIKRSGLGGKYLTFFLAGGEYGLEILKVREIIGPTPITPVPRTPDYVRGVVNLRGKLIPVVDLGKKLALDHQSDSRETCIIVTESRQEHIGAMVDRVSEVLDIDADDIDEAPDFGSKVRTDYVLGIAKSGSRVKILLDVDRVLSGDKPDVQL